MGEPVVNSRGEYGTDPEQCNAQRQHTANILEAPKAYPQQDTPKLQNILTIDCRGLEFVEFKAEVRFSHPFFSFRCRELEPRSNLFLSLVR